MVSLTAIVAEIERRAKTREIGRLQEIRKRLVKHAGARGMHTVAPSSIIA